MAFTPVPTVIDGDDFTDDWTLAVETAVEELQTLQAVTSGNAVAGTTSGTTPATTCSLAITPAEPGLLLCFAHLYRSQTVIGDAFDTEIHMDGSAMSIHRSHNVTSFTANPFGVVGIAGANVGVEHTIALVIRRQVGGGTATWVADPRFNRVSALFIPNPS